MKHIRLAKPIFSESDILEINRNIRSVLASGWLTTGEFAERLESRFRKEVETRYAVSMNSGTAALHTMIAWLRLKPGEEVVVPANTFASTANAVLYEGGKVVLADCDLDSFNVTADSLVEKITGKTRAIVVTHVGGNPCDMREIVDICEERKIHLFEDAAHALGSTYRGQKCGSFGSGAAFSLYPTKVVTSGEGGMLTTNSKDLAGFAQLFRNVGRHSIGAGPIEILGHNYRMSDIHAVVGLNQMKHLSEFIAKRNELAHSYARGLKRIGWIKPQVITAQGRSSYYAYIVRLVKESPVSRDALVEGLKNRGVETTVMFRPLHSQPYFRGRGTFSCPNAEALGRESLVLPLHVGMTNRDVEYVINAIEELAL